MGVRNVPATSAPWLWLLLLLIYPCWADFLSFEPGVEYTYRIQTVSKVSKVEEPFHIRAQISGRGEIRDVWYQPSEDPEVVNTKKGILGFLSAKLHHNHEVGKPGEDSWEYVTNETGHEGHHLSKYSVERLESGLKVTKVREGHPAMGANSESRMEKHVYFNTGKKFPHRVFMKEKVSTPRNDQPGFDIHKETRGGSFVNEEQKVGSKVDTEQDYFKRGIKEAIYIRALQSSLNRDGGRYRLQTTFDPLLTSHVGKITCPQHLGPIAEED
ncbi:hypothetical protein Bbelb_365550 [Branchiostoma belcheri]|nr:hypothetical protein Bbelb_365550 [Branchiostoma belcheri]